MRLSVCTSLRPVRRLPRFSSLISGHPVYPAGLAFPLCDNSPPASPTPVSWSPRHSYTAPSAARRGERCTRISVEAPAKGSKETSRVITAANRDRRQYAISSTLTQQRPGLGASHHHAQARGKAGRPRGHNVWSPRRPTFRSLGRRHGAVSMRLHQSDTKGLAPRHDRWRRTTSAPSPSAAPYGDVPSISSALPRHASLIKGTHGE